MRRTSRVGRVIVMVIVGCLLAGALAFAGSGHGRPVRMPEGLVRVPNVTQVVTVAPRQLRADRSRVETLTKVTGFWRPGISPTPDRWDRIGACENGDLHIPFSADWNSSVGQFEGGLQFSPSTWRAYAPASYPRHAYDATEEQQKRVATIVLTIQGPGAWPRCSQLTGALTP